MFKPVHQLNNNNDNKVDNCIKEIKTIRKMKTSKQLTQKSDDNSVVVILDLESIKTSVSLDELTDNFAYFDNKSNLKYFDKNKNIFALSNLSKASFKTLIKLTIDGELFFLSN